MASFFTELKRRNVFKVGIAYAIIAWLLIQVVATVLPMFGAPDWVAQTLTFIILLGLPIAVFFAWAYEITPEGVRPTHQVAAEESITRMTGRKFDFIIIGLLALAVIYLVVDRNGLEDPMQPMVVKEPETQDASLAEPVAPVAPETGPEVPIESTVLPNSVAVLPLENLSPDPEEAYFATGIHDEILNHLAKLRNLNVIARTSVQQYSDTNKPIPQIAEELNVETVMEGSIRYANGRVRLVAQLIDAESGAHLWSDAYEHDFDDIFAIQADIAMNIANALEAEFSLEEQAEIEKLPTESAPAYALYLRATQILNAFNPARDEAYAYLDQSLELDPEFALAMATYAYYLALEIPFQGFAQGFSNTPEILKERARELATRALNIDPSVGRAYLARAVLYEADWSWMDANREHELAFAASPKDPLVFQRYIAFKRNVGEYEKAIELSQNFVESDPANHISHHMHGVTNAYAHRYEEAIESFNNALELQPTWQPSFGTMAHSYGALGQIDESLKLLETYSTLNGPVSSQVSLTWSMLGYDIAGDTVRAEEYADQLEELSQDNDLGLATWTMIELVRGNESEALERFAQALEEKRMGDQFLVWEIKANIWNHPILNTPEFQALRDSVGLEL